MIRNRILSALEEALKTAAPNLNGLAVDDPAVWEAVRSGLKLERPRNPEHGDFAVNVSFLARQTKMPPPKIAEALAAALAHGGGSTHDTSLVQGGGSPHPNFSVSIVGGYLNFKLSQALLREALTDIVHSVEPDSEAEPGKQNARAAAPDARSSRKAGQNESLSGERILLEYVSANPTGPLHIGHGRWAALGDSIVRILRHCGAIVTPEFYINDAGVQMQNIAHSVYFRCCEIVEEEDKTLPRYPKETGEPPYPGEYVIDLAQIFLQDPEHKSWIIETHLKAPFALLASDQEYIQNFCKDILLRQQKKLLADMRVNFYNWVSEKKDIHDTGIIPTVLKKLEQRGFTYEDEGALWFESTKFSDEKNRVLRKSGGLTNYTYLTPDIAYHDEKFNRLEPESNLPYTKIINIWGADHHGYIPRMRGAIQALGHNADKFEVLLGQLVNLIVDGERTRMGKRRKMLTLSDVVEEVGVDATRFWMVSKSADSSLDFDVDLAASASSENPVFYVQYAHARCASILRNATEPVLNTETGETGPPFVTEEALAQYEETLTPEALRLLFDSMPDERDRNVLTTLLLQLDDFGQTVQDAARLRSPHLLTQYMMALAAQFHSFYGVCRILTPEPELTKARLMLILALRKTLAQALDLIGVSAPDKM